MTYSNKLASDNYVYLYNGKGAGPISSQQAERSFRQYLGGRSAQLVTINDPSYFQNIHKLTSAAAVIFPGGSANQMAGALQSEGIQGVKDLVEKQNASYIGFCAGAYLACNTSYLIREKEKDTEARFNYEMDLMDYPHYGPAYVREGTDSPSLKTSKVIRIQLADNLMYSYHVYWNGGGYFKDTQTSTYYNIRMAYYRDVENAIAVSHNMQKKNPIILSEIHPEIQFSREETEKYCQHWSEEDKENYLNSAHIHKSLLARICQAAQLYP